MFKFVERKPNEFADYLKKSKGLEKAGQTDMEKMLVDIFQLYVDRIDEAGKLLAEVIDYEYEGADFQDLQKRIGKFLGLL